ncbi:hypothetical protein OG410_25645 [Streptomyces sp. NBC_00659]|uniref:hypothetical protein n=1 Tax=Streptomyces sp. NBC_00659 TaxID=2903669 RepID=UPI002E344FFC|nr:hypothetical protein [Streptomyces sp. NBC_00659]
MAQRWDADRGQWVDDGTGRTDGVQDGVDAGGAPPAGDQWWAAATQAGPLRPDAYPPAGSAPPQPPQPPHGQQQPWAQSQQQAQAAWSHQQSQPHTWPGGVVPPGGRPPGSGDSRRLLLVIVAVAVLAGGVGGGLWALTRGDSARHPGAHPSTPSVTVTASQPGSVPETSNSSGGEGVYTAPAVTTAPAPAPGYSRSVDPVGYTVDVPDGWAREEKQGKLAPVVTYTAPDGNRRLLVFEIMEPSAAESSAQAESIAQGAKDYQYLDRRSGTGWTEFSYSYYDKRYGATQTVDHRFQAADGTPYAIVASGPPGTDMSGQLATAVNSFCPTGAACVNAA